MKSFDISDALIKAISVGVIKKANNDSVSACAVRSGGASVSLRIDFLPVYDKKVHI